MTVSQHGQHQHPETEAAKWNSAIIYFILLCEEEKTYFW